MTQYRKPPAARKSDAACIVASFGGGVNSTAMLIGLAERGEPCNLILFADTGGEKPHTMAHVASFSNWLLDHGYPAITTVRRPHETLESDCLKRNALPGVAYGVKSCSDHFKMRPQRDYMKAHGIVPSVSLIGFDAGEPHRARDFQGNRYPLIEWGWDRRRCVEAIDRAHVKQPGKSSCFFCPNSKKPEILQLRERYPDLAARAVAMERNAQLTEIAGLGRSYAWGDLYAAADKQDDMFTDLPFARCDICYDG